MACDTTLCETYLPQLQAAYYGLLTGDRKTSFKYRERTITYQSVNDSILKELKSEMIRLEGICGCKASARRKPLRLGRGINCGC